MRHHVPSTQIRPEASEALARFLRHIDVVVTIHGYGRRGFFTSLLLGGRNRALADHVAAHLRPKLPAYDIVTELERIPPDLRGMHADKPGEPADRRRCADRAPAACSGFEPVVVGLGGRAGAPHRGADRRTRRRRSNLACRVCRVRTVATGSNGADLPIACSVAGRSLVRRALSGFVLWRFALLNTMYEEGNPPMNILDSLTGARAPTGRPATKRSPTSASRPRCARQSLPPASPSHSRSKQP
jgi:hypothetical protein